MKYSFLTILMSVALLAGAQQQTYWQQHVDYSMEIDMDVTTHRFKGVQKLVYTNNSPDTLKNVYYHLYFNAFQPGSMMDVRSRSIADPDGRVGDRISKLSDDEIGYQHIESLKQNGKAVKFSIMGTVMEVMLDKPILPGKQATFDMEFEGQVPIQIRRSGRDNKEGISYSMSQWYPKLAEYDYMGWHTTPYIGREFHGVWGNFDVKITIDSDYLLGGTGYLQNPNDIGKGYGKEPKSVGDKLTWHFKAPMVHDFMWAADPDYVHKTAEVKNGPTLHFIYQEDEAYKAQWEKLPEFMVRAMAYVSENFGEYTYDQYTFIQGGDGGMEYPMSTLVTGNRSIESLVGVCVHEMVHNWHQGVLATNESMYEWMDEGFTSFVQHETEQYLFNEEGDPHAGSYRGYFLMAGSGNEEPLTTHADHYKTNRSYGLNAYYKGAVFLNQLSYIVGRKTFMRGMRRYYNEWKYKHPTPNDLIRIMEKETNMNLDWYVDHFVNTTNQIDYSINSVVGQGDKTFITLEREKEMMMPIDLHVTYSDGSKEILYIPLRMMLHTKEVEDTTMQRQVFEAWPWTNPTYTLQLNRPIGDIVSVEIDETDRLADINRDNNVVLIDELTTPYTDPTK